MDELSPVIKVCTKCSIEKPLNEYHKDKKAKDGRMNICKKCKAKYDKKYVSENRDKVNERQRAFSRANVGRYAEYNKIYTETHREHTLAYSREYYSKNKIQINKNSREHNAYSTPESRKKRYESDKANAKIRMHKYKARKKDLKATLTKAQWDSCVIYFNRECAYCGEDSNICQEHVIPVFSGGSYSSDNIVPACKRCNSSKCNRELEQWYMDRPFYSKAKHIKILKYLKQQKLNPIE